MYICICKKNLLVQSEKKYLKWIGSQRYLYSSKNYLFDSYVRFQYMAFIKEHLMIFPVWCSVYIGVINQSILEQNY